MAASIFKNHEFFPYKEKKYEDADIQEGATACAIVILLNGTPGAILTRPRADNIERVKERIESFTNLVLENDIIVCDYEKEEKNEFIKYCVTFLIAFNDGNALFNDARAIVSDMKKVNISINKWKIYQGGKKFKAIRERGEFLTGLQADKWNPSDIYIVHNDEKAINKIGSFGKICKYNSVIGSYSIPNVKGEKTDIHGYSLKMERADLGGVGWTSKFKAIRKNGEVRFKNGNGSQINIPSIAIKSPNTNEKNWWNASKEKGWEGTAGGKYVLQPLPKNKGGFDKNNNPCTWKAAPECKRILNNLIGACIRFDNGNGIFKTYGKKNSEYIITGIYWAYSIIGFRNFLNAVSKIGGENIISVFGGNGLLDKLNHVVRELFLEAASITERSCRYKKCQNGTIKKMNNLSPPPVIIKNIFIPIHGAHTIIFNVLVGDNDEWLEFRSKGSAAQLLFKNKDTFARPKSGDIGTIQKI